MRELADEALELLATADPLNELLVGFPGTEDRLNDLSEAAEQSLRDRAVRVLDAASRIEATGQDAITLGVLVEQTESLITRIDARLVEHTVHDGQTAPLGKLLELLASSRPTGAQQEQDFLTRLAAIPEFLAQGADRLRHGLSTGRLPIAGRVRAAVDYLDAHLAAPEADPLHLVPLNAAAERDDLLAAEVRPAFAAYREVLHAEALERGRPDDRAGLCWLPDGEATYAALVRMHTTTGRTPEELHRTGVELLAELAEEYAEIGSRIFGLRTAAEVQQRMRTDPGLRWSDGRELLAAAEAAIERAERGAPEWFGRLPAQRCQVAPVPADRAPNTSAAYYLPGPVDGSRPGTYYANTHLAEQRPRFLAEATAFHEAVPGHHFQITLAQELTGVPKIRQLAWVNAYMEGWGLYSERFADEAGWYTDDVARLGMLAMDSNRAARLVVDTGLHAFGWSRQRAVDYLRENTLMPEVEVQSETDRYLEMPGQALSYMVGRLEIERLRDRARAALGAAFDLRAFHDLVLGSGPLPMPVLDLVVADWTG
ncbi:Uncharacterized conserved protein, DUF885 familyt [Saccharopolyspora kobensis]|uniref:Uncharacterized conserved protein, DUF885 familyt n=1 Tax=Saccharopolyspora kobensis TaxID=146035 RepID=A0A1H6E715_9PSEU|nr:Uncharacterized conserved protein, DUF885 familyt [Saccharopolyspora kobensis]SFD39986.1 Uncharacterized conserved protein, DUF885 familyt [Saccharopolyspora kobensis]